jgi:sialic acid synthase SpsE/protoporphyrinogen oxidase
MNKNKIIILGAGPVGLITAWLLAKNKWNVELYELKNQVGGMCRTWKWDNFFLDTGPHIFHTSDINLWKFWKKIFGNDLIKGEYWSKNVYGDDHETLVDYPISLEGLKVLPQVLQARIKSELKDLKINKKPNTTRSFSEHVSLQVGKTLQKLFFEGYPEKVWGLSAEDMTSEWAPKRIKFTKNSEPFFLEEFTGVGKYGTGHLYEKIKNNFLRCGGKLYLNHRVIRINHSNNELKKIDFSNKKSTTVFANDLVISSLPITLTARLLGYNSNLKFRGIRSVYVSINKIRCLPKKVNWLYFSDKNIIFNRVSEPKTMSKFLSPKNKTFLCVEIAYSKEDFIDKMSFKDIRLKVINDLIKVKLLNNKDVLSATENKEDFVYPVQFIDYKKELSDTKQDISKFHQIYSLGTGGDFDYADSQILFNKSIDLVNILNDKFSKENFTKKKDLNMKLNKIVKLGKKIVGEDNPTYVIAEAGLNHNGDLALAKRLIDQASELNCDSIKFQTYLENSRVSSKVKSVNYVEKADGLREDINEMFQRLSINKKFHQKIFSYARKKKIEIFSTPFDDTSVDYLEELKVSFYKLASVDIVNIPLIKKIGLTNKPLIMSTGMSDISTVFEAVEVFKETGNKNLILLHCLSSYPANEKEMNLKAINTLKKIFNVPVGLSDHYPGLEVSLMAIGVGANIIERHFTLNKSYEGPDHHISSEPDEFKKLLNFAKNSNFILGSGEKKIQPSEYEVINSQRKSLYAKKNILKNEKFTEKNVIIKGPAGGILPNFLNIIIGKKAKKTIKKDFPITWDLI